VGGVVLHPEGPGDHPGHAWQRPQGGAVPVGRRALQQQLEQALALAETARQAAPDNPYIADTLGWVLYHRATYERALGLLAESAQKLPENPTVQFHLGMVNLKLDRKEAAFQALNRALELDSSFREAEEARRALSELQ